ncbi:hypothetical protein [Streptomyces sp. AHA2]|uniref:hypothetical protein n=1 Tax=Streptomyces sp. AHA2 TaxID=3064526 RepID=UPI002FE03A2A
MKKPLAVTAAAAVAALGALAGCSLTDDNTECTTYSTVAASAPAPRPAPAPRVAPSAPKPNFNKPPKTGQAQPSLPRVHTTCWEKSEK